MHDCPFDLDHVASSSGIASLEYRAEVGSTNDLAIQLSTDEQRRYPLLVLAGRQTQGRGRSENRWWSSAGALTFSLVVEAAGPSQRWPLAALATGVAVCEALQTLFPPGAFGLKWPNDVYLAGRKLCGVLVEAPSQARSRIVIGVGINVNVSLREAPAEVQRRATSLADEAGGTFDLSETLVAVVSQILPHCEEAIRGEASLTESFRRYCLLTDRAVCVQSGRQELVGRCRGIADDGSLLLSTPGGEQRIQSGTVVRWE
jgi:BirA family biotin operon repressor/biotin-[acetyl-CoA-carboxylase] ligase